MSQRAKKFDQFVNEFDDFMTSSDPIRLIEEDGMGGTVKGVENLDVVCSALIPMQVHIDPEKSIKHCLQNPNVTRNLFAHDPIMIKKPIVIYNRRYIMDGHHAWAEAVIFRPEAEISCINLIGEVDPKTMLENVRRALMLIMADSTQGRDVRSRLDLFTMSEPEVRHYVESNMSEQSEEVFAEHGVRYPIEHAVDGIERMQHNNFPIYGAKKRTEMPQFGSGIVRRGSLDSLSGRVEETFVVHGDSFEPNVDPKMGFSSEFIERITTNRELTANGLLPPNWVAFEPPSDPRKIFSQFKDGTWVAAVIDDKGNMTMRQQDGGELRNLAVLNESEKYDMLNVDHRMRLPLQYLRRLSALYSLVTSDLMEPSSKPIRMKTSDENFRFYSSDGGWILLSTSNQGHWVKMNTSTGTYKKYDYDSRDFQFDFAKSADQIGIKTNTWFLDYNK